MLLIFRKLISCHCFIPPSNWVCETSREMTTSPCEETTPGGTVGGTVVHILHPPFGKCGPALLNFLPYHHLSHHDLRRLSNRRNHTLCTQRRGRSGPCALWPSRSRTPKPQPLDAGGPPRTPRGDGDLCLLRGQQVVTKHEHVGACHHGGVSESPGRVDARDCQGNQM